MHFDFDPCSLNYQLSLWLFFAVWTVMLSCSQPLRSNLNMVEPMNR